MRHLLLPLLAALALPACATEVVYKTPEQAWNECRSWMKEGVVFISEMGMATTWLLGGCLEDSAYTTKKRWKWLVKN